MSESNPSGGASPPAQLGRKGSFFLGTAIGLVVLIGVGAVVVWRGSAAEDRRKRVTAATMERIAKEIRDCARTTGAVPRADGLGDDWTGLKALAAGLGNGAGGFATWELRENGEQRFLAGSGKAPDGSVHSLMVSVLDGWGNPLRYRCPGVVHHQGWDLYSSGPNGKDDQGTFDDVCIGEDLAPISSK